MTLLFEQSVNGKKGKKLNQAVYIKYRTKIVNQQTEV